VRFTPNSDRESGHPQEFMSALPPKADMCIANTDVCFGPKADIQLLIDYSICSRKYALGYGNSEALGFADVDNQFKIGRLFHRQIGWPCTFQDLVRIEGRAPK